jgi:hypothetical protein
MDHIDAGIFRYIVRCFSPLRWGIIYVVLFLGWISEMASQSLTVDIRKEDL